MHPQKNIQTLFVDKINNVQQSEDAKLEAQIFTLRVT